MTANDSQVAALERNILQQAERLAAEHIANAQATCERILREATERLRLREEHAILTAKAEGERLYRRRVQAAAIRLRADTDRLRWTLVSAVMDQLRRRLAEVAEGADYPALLRRHLQEAARAIGGKLLHARLNARDRPRFAHDWLDLAQQAAPQTEIVLDQETFTGMGGVVVLSADGLVRVDNSFEGRLALMEDELQRVIMEALFATPPHQDAAPHG